MNKPETIVEHWIAEIFKSLNWEEKSEHSEKGLSVREHSEKGIKFDILSTLFGVLFKHRY